MPVHGRETERERQRERETERERNSDAEAFSDLKRKNKIVKNVNRVRFVE